MHPGDCFTSNEPFFVTRMETFHVELSRWWRERSTLGSRTQKKHEFGLLANIKLGNVRGFTRPSNSPRANGCLPLSPTWAMRYGYSSMLGPPLNSNSAVNCSSQQIFDFVHTITFFNSILYGFYLKLLLIFIYIFFLSLLGGFESPHRSGYIPILVHPGPSWSIIPFSPWGVPTFWACNGQNSQWQFVVSCRGPRHWVPLGTTGYWGSGKVAFHQDSNMWYFVISCVIHPSLCLGPLCHLLLRPFFPCLGSPWLRPRAPKKRRTPHHMGHITYIYIKNNYKILQIYLKKGDIMGANDNLCDICFFVSKWRIYHDTPLFSMIWCFPWFHGVERINSWTGLMTRNHIVTLVGQKWSTRGQFLIIRHGWKSKQFQVGDHPATSGFSSQNRIPKCTPNTGWSIHGQVVVPPSQSLFSTNIPE